MAAITILLMLLPGWSGSARVPLAPGEEPNLPAWWQMERLPARQEAIGEDDLVARFYYPARGAPPWPAVILLGGSEGGLITARNRIDPLVASGYCVLSVAYFRAEGLPSELVSVPLEFYDRAKAWLADEPRVAGGGIALIGSSKGGELALLLAGSDPNVRCVVGMVPASHVFQGISVQYQASSSWAKAGVDLPFVPYEIGPTLFQAIASRKFCDVYREALAHAGTAAESARIPVEKTNGAVLLLSAQKDEVWPSTQMCDAIVTTLEEQRFGYPFKHIAYDTGHSIGSSREHWIEITRFLRDTYLDGGTSHE